jgi:hypothetical protein
MSSNIIYTSVGQLINSSTDLKARIAALTLVLNNMQTLMLDKDDTKIYELDTSQTRVQKTYASYVEINNAYEKIYAMRKRMLTELNYNANGRITRLVDGKNFIGRNF